MLNENVNSSLASIDGQVKIITEASLRRHLKLEDLEGQNSLPNSEILKQLALMGYVSDTVKLTFQKGNFSPQWRFLIHTVLHCLSPKKTLWEQFSSNIATAIICLATNRTFNFSKFIFEAMVKNLDNPHKFLMYPRFIQICLNKQKRLLQPHTRTYPTPSLTQKVFSNMKRPSKGYSGVVTPLFDSMLNLPHGEAPSTSPSKITSSPSQSSQPSSPSPQPSPAAEETAPTPHESPLQNSINKVARLESELKHTKETYNAALTKLIKRGRKIFDIDEDPNISLVQDEGMTWDQEKASDDTELVLQEDAPTELARFEAEQELIRLQQEQQKKSDFETSFELEKQLDKREEVVWDQIHDFRPIDSELEVQRKGQEVQKEQVEEEIVQQEDVVAEQVEIESSKKAEGSLKRKTLEERIDITKKQMIDKQDQ
ncbi:hypothetical protein Tco_1004735 [Tanacetum coccineum]|uniref:Synaptobrevin, longin-like domain protein n=1 Tax=Tanacetum coccineum TaxID=301880 RepID=A0ABQ5FD68_9ASTR